MENKTFVDRVAEVLITLRPKISEPQRIKAAAEIEKIVEEMLPEDKDYVSAPFSNRTLTFADGWNECKKELRRRLKGGK